MRTSLRAATGLLALAVLPANGVAQDHPLATAPSPGVYRNAVDASRVLIDDMMDSVGVPGLSIAVMIDGELTWEEGFGFADLENKVGVRPETKFRIASISKSLTAGAIGLLVEEGRLDLDAPVQRYVPSFPEKAHPITTRQLGGHLAGIRHYRGDEFASQVHYDDVVDALEIFEDDALQSAPGEAYSYSTYGWNLISAVVQGAAGESFLQYMRRRVIEPLGMTATVAEHADSIIPNRADFYLRDGDGRIRNAPYVDNSNKWAGGGYLSTARDMAVYGSAYLGDELLRPETVALLTTGQRTTAGEETNYGIGWRTQERNGRREIWHTGGAMGGTTVLVIRPDTRVVVAVLNNTGGAGVTGLARAVAEHFENAMRGMR